MLIVSPASPELKPLAKITQPNKEEYAYRMGINIHFPVYLDASKDHRFGRVAYMREFLPQCDWLLFMGADTIFMDMTHNINQLCDYNYDIIASWDNMGLQSDVMFLKNCPQVLSFLDNVLEMRDDTMQRKGFMESSDQGAIVRLLSGRSTYFDESLPIEPQVITSAECQNYGLRVKEESRKINSYLHTFNQGDLIFHCAGMPLHEKVIQTEIMLKHVKRRQFL